MPTPPITSYDHPGRPTKFNKERCDKIITALQAGNYREVACRYAGISNQTLRNWLKQAENPDAPPEYLEFLAAIEKAEADAEVADIALIRRSAQDGQWQAAAWIRERKNPERWGRRDASKIEVTGADGGPVDMRVTLGVDSSAIESLAMKLESRRRAVEADSTELE
jgi:transposase-like protein